LINALAVGVALGMTGYMDCGVPVGILVGVVGFLAAFAIFGICVRDRRP
jgi:hypothetical protein